MPYVYIEMHSRFCLCVQMDRDIGKKQAIIKPDSINKGLRHACTEVIKDNNNSRLKDEKAHLRILAEAIDDMKALWFL